MPRDEKQQSCPVCATLAVYYEVDFGNLKYFNCPKCSKYLISRRAEKLVGEGSQGRRDELSRAAASSPDAEHVLWIRIPPATQDASGVQASLVASYEPKAKFRL